MPGLDPGQGPQKLGLLLLPEAVALAADVEDMAVVEEPVVGPGAKLVDDDQLRRQVDGHPSIESMLTLGAAECLEELLRADEVNAKALLDGPEAERNGQVRLADARRAEQQDIGGLALTKVSVANSLTWRSSIEG